MKKGKEHYRDAIDCYTRAINQKALNDSETSVLFSNRAHVNLMLENYRWALNDAEEAIKLSPSNVKVVNLAKLCSFFFCVILCILHIKFAPLVFCRKISVKV